MNYTEKAIVFDCERDALAGILAVPELAASIGVLIIVGGPQYRAGSHRQFLLLSRALAAAGYPVLRFDYRGMGDSAGAQHEFTDVTADIAAALDAMLAQIPTLRQIALWGLCDGASAALLYCQETQDARVCGLCLLNPWVRSEASLARAHVKYYYVRRLKQKEFWVKFLKGKMAATAIVGAWQNLRRMSAGSPSGPATSHLRTFQQRMAIAWSSFGGSILLLLSGQDYTAKEFVEYARMDAAWAGLLERAHVVRHDLPDADHTFSSKMWRAKVEALTLDWLQKYVVR